MTATERLRQLLDERGVEHYDGTERTLWGYEQTGKDTGIYRFAASEISGGFLQFDMFRITPEQAIAATLGNGECTPHGEWESITQTQEVRRVFCDCGYELGMDERDSWPFKSTRLFAMPNYCQECGRKIRKAVKR